ncbi:unnamed protein product [Calypogeia fissa]
MDSFSKAREKGLLGCLLLDLLDGQGRPPLHVAVDSNKVQEFLDLISSEGENWDLDDKLIEKILNAPDNAGRTPLYRAAAQNQLVAVERLLKDKWVSLNARMSCKADQWGLDLDNLSWRKNFKRDCVYIPKDKLIELHNQSNGTSWISSTSNQALPCMEIL